MQGAESLHIIIFLICLAVKTERFSVGAVANIAWAGLPVCNGKREQYGMGKHGSRRCSKREEAAKTTL